MFNSLTDKLHSAFRKLTGNSTLTESNMGAALDEIRTALLDADVNYEIADKFIESVKAECAGQDVLKSVTPGQQTIKIVFDKLVELMGTESVPLVTDGQPSVIMLCGLHGSGKTTTSAKLAQYIQKKLKKRVLLAACDLQRPAAIDQLEVLGHEIGLPVYTNRETKDVVAVAVKAVAEAKRQLRDVVILDTAGRLQIDEDLVQELVKIKEAIQPQEILLVGDSALGQEAVSVANHFNDALGITGIILTKLDGDARGGAALSMRQTTGQPIKFITVGEKTTDLEAFHPDRMASRILGMGDIVSLVERAAEQIKAEEAEALEEKIRNSTFGFDDFLDQLSRVKKMGGLMSLLKFLPGMDAIPPEMLNDDSFKRTEGIINSMTQKERRLPEIINASRRDRIAKGSGAQSREVAALIRQFMQMRVFMSQISKQKDGGAGMLGTLMSGLQGGFGGMRELINSAARPTNPQMAALGNLIAAGQDQRPQQQQTAAQRQAEKAKKDAKRKMAEKSKKKNRKHK